MQKSSMRNQTVLAPTTDKQAVAKPVISLTKRLTSISIFTALIIVGGLISVPIPFTQVEFSLQVSVVLLSGLVLGGANGAISVLIYIIMGLSGLPVFTQGGGLGYVFMPSFGYLLGFPIGAFICGALRKKRKTTTKSYVFLCALVGMMPIYIMGMTYQALILYYYTGLTWQAALGGLPAVAVLAVKDTVLLGVISPTYMSLKRAMAYRR